MVPKPADHVRFRELQERVSDSNLLLRNERKQPFQKGDRLRMGRATRPSIDEILSPGKIDPRNAILEEMSQLPKDKEIYLYCT